MQIGRAAVLKVLAPVKYGTLALDPTIAAREVRFAFSGWVPAVVATVNVDPLAPYLTVLDVESYANRPESVGAAPVAVGKVNDNALAKF